MSAQTDQIKADVEALQTATANAADHINTLTEQVLAGNVTDEQFANLHNALVAATDDLNKAVEDSQNALNPPAR